MQERKSQGVPDVFSLAFSKMDAFFLSLTLGLGHPFFISVGASPFQGDAPNLTSLNIRLSSVPIKPPATLIRNSIILEGIHAASAQVGPSPQSAILEDDQRHRVVVLSQGEDGRITAHLLYDVALESKLPTLVHCTKERECAYDRRPITGGLGCVAICLQNILDPNFDP